MYIVTDNILPNKEHNFNHKTTLTNVKYDYGSVMHYGAKVRYLIDF